MRKLAILAVLLAASVAWGQSSVDIAVPDKVDTGTLVVATIKDLGARSASWMPISPLDLVYHADKDNSTITFAAGCQASQVVLIVTVVDWDAKQLDQQRVIVTVGEGPEPKPDPKPDPEPQPPPPGKRKVVVIAESADNTVWREHEVNAIRDYCKAAGHTFGGIYDPDQKDASGKTPDWLSDYLSISKEIGLPVMVIVVPGDESDLAQPVPLAPAGDTIPKAKAAGEKMIEAIKELGG